MCGISSVVFFDEDDCKWMFACALHIVIGAEFATYIFYTVILLLILVY